MQYTPSNQFSGVPAEKPGLVSQRKRVIILVVILLLVFVLIFVFGNRKKPAGSYGEYYDPGSKETVSNPKGKSPENNGQADAAIQPVYLGTSKLLEFGVSTDQLRVFKQALSKYSANSKEFSIYVDTVNTVSVERGANAKITFDLLVNRDKKVLATLEYYDATKIRLTISDRSGTKQFDSGELDASKIPDPSTQTTPDPNEEFDVDQGDGGPPSQ